MKRILCLSVIAVCIPLSGRTRIFRSAQKPIELNTAATGILYATIDGYNDTITIHPSSDALVHINGIKKGSEADLKDADLVMSTKNNTLAIKNTKPDANKAKFNYTIALPSNIRELTILNKKGDITINGIASNITATSDVGNILMYDVKGHISARTNYGSIEVDHQALAPNTTIDLETINGHIYLYVPSNTVAKFKARTNNGTVKSTLPITLEEVTRSLDKEHWKLTKQQAIGTIGKDGTASIILKVLDKGNITVKSK